MNGGPFIKPFSLSETGVSGETHSSTGGGSFSSLFCGKISYTVLPVLVCGIFYLKFILPGEWRPGLLYMFPILLTLGARRLRDIVIVTALCCLFIAADSLIRIAGKPPALSPALYDNSITILILALLGAVVYHYKALRQSRTEQIKQHKVVIELGRQALILKEIDQLFEWVHHTLTVHFGSRYSKILRYLPEENRTLLVSGIGWSEEIKGKWGESTESEETFSGYTLRRGQAVLVKDLRKETRFKPPALLLKHDIRSCINVIIPERNSKVPYGILEVDTRQANRFSSEHVVFLESIAQFLSDAMYRCILTKQLETRTDLLERSNQELEAFVSVASHDLKEPIRAMKLLTEMTEQELEGFGGGRDDAGFKTYFQQMEKTTANMLELLDGLLAYSRYGRQELILQEIDLGRLIQEIRMDFHATLEQKKAVMEVCEMPLVHGDKIQLRQVFANLLSNALKYSHPERAPRIVIKTRDIDGKFCEISIEDNGIGIDPKSLGKIFEPFTRLRQAGKQSEGSGLGLSICKTIMLRHGGDIYAKSHPQKGSIFYVVLKKKE